MGENDGNEFSDEGEDGEKVKDEFWEEKFCVSDGKTHGLW